MKLSKALNFARPLKEESKIGIPLSKPPRQTLAQMRVLLDKGFESGPLKDLTEEKQKAIQAGAFSLPAEDPGLSMMFGIGNMGTKAEDLEAAMNVEFDKVKNELISEDEYQKLRNQTENDFVSGNLKMAGIAENLANYYVYYKDANLINTEINRYLKVTREDIQKAAQKYLNKENRVVLYYLPKQ